MYFLFIHLILISYLNLITTVVLQNVYFDHTKLLRVPLCIALPSVHGTSSLEITLTVSLIEGLHEISCTVPLIYFTLDLASP